MSNNQEEMKDEVNPEIKGKTEVTPDSNHKVTDKATDSIEVTSAVSTTKEMTENELQTLNYTEFDTPAKMLALAKVLVKSSLVPLKKEEDVVVALMAGQRLGLPFDTSVSQIYPINGRATLGVHIMRGILLKHGVYFNRIRNNEPFYEFVVPIPDQPGKFNVVKYGFLDEQPKDTAKKKIDVKTEYLFERDIQSKYGKIRTIKISSSFSYNDAFSAGYLEKDVWIKQFPRMLDARAFTIGAKEIAGDLLYGMPSTDEMLDNVKGKTYIMNDDFSITQQTQNKKEEVEEIEDIDIEN